MINLPNSNILIFTLLLALAKPCEAQNCYGYRDTSFNHTSYWVFDSSEVNNQLMEVKFIDDRIYIHFLSPDVNLKAYDLSNLDSNNIKEYLFFKDTTGLFELGETELYDLTDSTILVSTFPGLSNDHYRLNGLTKQLQVYTGFGIGGYNLVELTPNDFYGTIKVVRNNGIFIPYYNSNSRGIIKYNPNGYPDLVFNGGISNLLDTSISTCERVEILNNTGIACGVTQNDTVSNQLYLHFFNIYNGLPDTTVSVDAYRFYTLPNYISDVNDIKYDQATQSLYISYCSYGPNRIIRINSLFNLDTTFAGDGVLTNADLGLTSNLVNLSEVTISTNGRFLANISGGYCYLNSDGTLDNAFANNGIIGTSFDSLWYFFNPIKDLAIDLSEGKLYLLGWGTLNISSDNNPTLVRLNASSCFIGIDEIVEKPIVLYPNPTNSVLCTNSVDELDVSLYDILGNRWLLTKIDQSCYDIRLLSKGLYNCVLVNKYGQASSQKIIIYE